jgi:hypothetical protein
MKKKIAIFCLGFLPFLTRGVFAQDTIVGWTFPSTSADSIADIYSIPSNANNYVSCQYGTWNSPSYSPIHIDYTTNGFSGAPDKCGKATGWDNGADSAYWLVNFKTTGYGNLKLYSKQQGGGNNPGPRDFKVQYKLSGSNTWVDLTAVTCANNWTSGFVNGVDIPSICNNQSSQVSIRWLVSSNIDINGGTVLSTGISKIDDIVITGSVLSGIHVSEAENLIKIYPNPCNGKFYVENYNNINKIDIFNILGKCIYTNENIFGPRINLSGFEKGVYLVQITTKGKKILTHKLIVE